ncbi:hypothetical protein [Sphingomonas bacterium]|uniref:type II toxin-antitoxin system VapC family toxin n=1 Tax=Sphingomonas bacterium TaxID=1895847 RepID=UPI0026129409|nr:hypothetical protein [Sphingomonas bacterium]
MRYLLDTDVIIHIRDADLPITQRLAALSAPVIISLVTIMELQAGLVAQLFRDIPGLKLEVWPSPAQ